MALGPNRMLVVGVFALCACSTVPPRRSSAGLTSGPPADAVAEVASKPVETRQAPRRAASDRPAPVLEVPVLPGRFPPAPLPPPPALDGAGFEGLTFDLGAGEAPYDDSPPSTDLLPEGPRGFSDTVMRINYGQPIGPGVSLQGGVAASRYQDEPVFDSLGEVEMAWVSFGLRVRF